MHQLEEAARPILARPIQGDPVTLRGDDLVVTSTWAYKTCLMLDLAQGGEPRVGPLTYRHVYEHRRPPDSVAILTAAYGGRRHPLYAASHQPEFEVGVGDERRMKTHAYLLTVGVGHLLSQVFGHHLDWIGDLRPRGWKRDITRVLWPPSKVVRWPPPVPLNDQTLFAFGRSL
jgi:hypothetical protein